MKQCDISEQKAKLRKIMLKRRKENYSQIPLLSNTAQSLILKEKIWRQCRFPALYMALPGETETSLLLQTAIMQNKTPLLPKIISLAQKTMIFYACKDAATLIKGPMGILEPPGAQNPLQPDLMIIPGLAFDKAGNRLGYGGGFYDRYLADLPTHPLLMALCCSWQLLPQIPADNFDYKVNAVCTEKGLIWIGKNSQICQTDLT